jgi:conjugative relaxase-like TrwC/TraI family protein
MLNGAHPLTAERLGSPPRDHRVAGFDLAFRAPKSVSLLYGLGDFQTVRQVRAAHEQAIVEAVGYLERHAALVSRGHARARQERADGFLAAAYQHRTSRAGDPLLHTHVLVANLGRGPDGRWTALYGRALYRHAKTAGYLYQVVLRAELTRRIGVAWGPVRNGVADVRGIRRPVIEEFSQRRQQIRQRLAQVGHHTARSAQAAALGTRPAKQSGISEATLRGSWHRRAAAIGLSPHALAALLGRASALAPTEAEIHAAIAHLACPQGLTLHTSTFTRREVLQGLCDTLPAGADVSVADLERLAGSFLQDERVRPVTNQPRPGWNGEGTDRRAPAGAALAEEWRFTTQELLDTEQAAVMAAIRRQGEGVGMVPPPMVEQVVAAHTRTVETAADTGMARRPVLSDEQAAMVRALATSPDGVQLVNAKAGSGKTSVLGAAGQAWEGAGYRVVGTALAARAARELHRSSGIPSDTIAKLLGDLDDPSTPGMTPDTVLVIDEAGMVGTRQLARLLAHAQYAGAKVVAVGDVEQLPEIEAGGLFRILVRRLGAAELQTNQRQREPWEQQALDLLRAGDAIAAIARYAEHGRVVVRSRAGRLRNRLVQDWWAAAQRPGEQPPIMIALRRSDVADLNDRARALLAEHGRLGPDPITIDRREFAVGDRIITLRNARRLGVLNGTLATVTGLDHDRGALLVRTDEGRELVLPRWYLDRPGPFHHRRRVDHAYAITCHKAQGMTTDCAFVLATDELYKEWGYVAMSRGRLENKLYTTVDDHPLAEELDVPREPKPDAVLAVTAALELSRAQYLALDQLTATGGSSSTPPSHCEIHRDVGPTTAPPPPATSPAADPQEDLARLRVLHRVCSIELLHVREQLAAQRPGWRRRRPLSKTIASRQRTLDELDRQIARLEARPPEIATSQGGPATSGGAQASAKTASIEHDPPRYLIAELGGWPHTHAAQTVWRIAARRIRAYRSSAGVTDPKTALGPPPDDPNQHAEREAVAEVIRSAGKAIDALDSPARPDPTNPAVLELP